MKVHALNSAVEGNGYRPHYVFSHTETLGGFLQVDHGPCFLSYENEGVNLSDTEWVAKLDYVCDMFNLLNELNLSLQRRLTAHSNWQIN